MRRPILVLASLIAAVPVIAGGFGPSSPSPAHERTVVYPGSPSTDYAVLDIGSPAPDFSFESPAGNRRLHDLRAQGHVLLLLDPDRAQLDALEHERASLLQAGVVPMAILDERPGTCRATAQRLGLGYCVVPDPQHLIGAQFNALDPESHALSPAWFVLDRTGHVRAFAHGAWPDDPWSRVCATALGLPLPGSAAPASHRR